YQAVYSGDGNYTNTTPPAACEVLQINRLNSKVITDIQTGIGTSVLNHAVNTGTVIYDVAFVYGLPTGGTGTDPTATVTFQRFDNPTCSGTAVATEAATLVGGTAGDKLAKATSSTFTTTAGSFVCYKAAYNGDGIYLPSPASEIEPICAFTLVTPPNP